jgi:hypothetical protein
MTIIAPDVLAEGRDFSVGFCAAGVGVGLLLWLTGWQWHRFWIVLVATLSAGVLGIMKAASFGLQPLAVGLLLAVAAGVLALALVRVIAFTAAGFAGVIAVRSLPPAPWQEPVVCFLASGLIGLLLFRLWTMALTSFAGALLIGYFGLWLAERLNQIDAVALALEKTSLLDTGYVALGLAGTAVQLLWDRRQTKRGRNSVQYNEDNDRIRPMYDPRRWLNRGPRPSRRAG